MEQRPLGRSGLQVSQLGLGCARIGGIFQHGGSQGFLSLIAAAADAGITFFDTADMYSQGESEVLLGRALRGRRDRVVIASKAGYLLPAQRRLVARLKPLARPIIKALGLRRARLSAAVRGALSQDFSPAYLVRAVEGSLRRLRTDRLDLLQLHSPPAEVVAAGGWVAAVERLQREGKILRYGISVDDVAAGEAALRFPGLAALQLPVSALEPGLAEALLPAARAAGVGVIARECLANGLLVKEPAAVDLAGYCRSPEEAARRAAQLAEHRAQAARLGRTPAEHALRFVTELPGVSVALVGARTVEQLQGLLQRSAA